jgi:hypothetical protein
MGVQMIMRVVLVMSITVLAVGCAAQDGRGPEGPLGPDSGAGVLKRTR